MSAHASAGFLDLPSEYRDAASAQAAIIPVPYDLTSSWHKGADQGPAALIKASAAVEWYDIETDACACKHGIITTPPVQHDGDPKSLAGKVSTAVEQQWGANRLPVVLGGEHSVSIGAIQAAAKRFPGMCVLQIDAHGDTREAYEGSPYNHACVMARAREVAPVIQVGIRAIEAEERAGMDDARVVWGHEIQADLTCTRWIDRTLDLLSDRVYITIDLDAFDPSVLPATGTPEPGGLTWTQMNQLLERVVQRSEVVAFDVVELCPREGMHASDFTAAKLVYRLLSLIAHYRGGFVPASLAHAAT
ncbi:MAG: agmatinase [Phycisphaerales bacterium]|nr:agmatinase [Phycisphaerales bacterium]